MKYPTYWGFALPIALLAPIAQGVAAASNPAIEEMVITASPHGKTAEEVAGSLNILGGDQLQRQVAGTLGETLKSQLGINSSSFGPAVGLPVIRGLSGKRVEILQNSMPVDDASATSPDHAIALEPMLADRIEILRGPATLRYGPGAIGGVVNIIDNRIHTAPFAGLEGALETRFDNNGNGKASVGRLDAGSGDFNFHASGVIRANDDMEIPGYAAAAADGPDDTTRGFVANTDADADSWTLGISRVSDKLVVGLGISRVNNDYGIPPGGHGHGEHEEEDHDDEHHDEEEHDAEEADHGGDLFTRIVMRQTEYSGKLLFPDLNGPFTRLDIDLSHSDYRHRELEIEGGLSEVGTRYAARTNNLRAELSRGSDDGWLGALGLQFNDVDFVALGEEAFVPPNQVRSGGLFITEETGFGGGTLALGLRLDRQTAEADRGGEQSHNLINASASYLYPLADNQQVSAILSHSQRAPTAEELFAEGEHVATNSYQVGDRDLDQESAHSLEITWSYTGPVAVSASVYHREFANFIFEARDGSRFSHDLEGDGLAGGAACSADLADFDSEQAEFDGALPCFFYRQEDARFSGVEAELRAPLGTDLTARLWGDAVRARLDKSGDVPRIPPARLGLDLDYTRDMWTAGVSFSHGFAQNDPGINEAATDSYSRIDAHLSLGNEQWTLFLKGTNLADKEIRNATSFLRDLAPEPGRSLVVGARFNF